MENKNRSASLPLWANRALMVIIAVLACSMPRLLRWYNQFRPLEKPPIWPCSRPSTSASP